MEILAPLLTGQFALAVVITLLSGFTYGFAGFGGGLTMVPLMALLYWPAEGVILSSFLPVVTGAVGLPGVLPHVRWREVVPALITVLVTAPVGAYFLITGDPGPIRRAMGAIVLFFALIMLLGWQYKGPRNSATGVLSGAIGGVVHGYLGMAGAWFSLYYLSGREEARIQRANLYITMLTVSAMAVIPHIVVGTMGRETWIRGIALVLPYAVAIWVGARAFRTTSDQSYRRVAIWLLVAIGLSVAIV